MKCTILSHRLVFLLGCIFAVQAKIVYLNGTEIADDNLKIVNLTTPQPIQKWFSVFNPRNISNHSGEKGKDDLQSFNRKNDEEEQEESIIQEENDHSSNGSMSTRDTTVLSNLRGIWTDITPMVSVLSTLLGLFLIFVMIQSPLSPLPVPPLPYPPIGPFPPTNTYPFGVPPVRHHYGVRYAEPSVQGSYRIPRNLETANETETMEHIIVKVVESIIPHSFEDIFETNKETWAEQISHSIKSFFIHLGTIVDHKSSQLLQEITESSSKGLDL